MISNSRDQISHARKPGILVELWPMAKVCWAGRLELLSELGAQIYLEGEEEGLLAHHMNAPCIHVSRSKLNALHPF